MKFLCAPLGSEGDINPMLALAGGLRDRGHDCLFLLNPHYGWRADGEGFRWIAIGSEEQFLQAIQDPRLWDARQGTARVMRMMLETLPELAQACEKALKRGPIDAVLTTSLGLACSFFAEARRLPRLMLHLQPACFRSLGDFPIYSQDVRWLARAPLALRRSFYWTLDRLLDVTLRPPLNRFRASLDLPPLKDVYRDAFCGAEGVAGLFPEWYARPESGWPAQTALLGFPLPPMAAPLPLDESLERFLAHGPAPLLWAHGSANLDTKRFYAGALTATRELGARCIVVGQETPAAALPEWAIHVKHAPFEHVFPRCAAVTNHGGIGTVSKALAAGVPQLVVHRAHDQPDNAARVKRLGAGEDLPYARFRASRAAELLRVLLSDNRYRASAEELAGRIRGESCFANRAADWVEGCIDRTRRKWRTRDCFPPGCQSDHS